MLKDYEEGEFKEKMKAYLKTWSREQDYFPRKLYYDKKVELMMIVDHVKHLFHNI